MKYLVYSIFKVETFSIIFFVIQSVIKDKMSNRLHNWNDKLFFAATEKKCFSLYINKAFTRTSNFKNL